MFQKTTLKNGLRLITANIEGTEAITALVLFKVGSRYETKSENGISHFIEHMMFKGTKKRPNTLALSKDLDRVGAEYNAFPSRDYTGYYVKALYSAPTLSKSFERARVFGRFFVPLNIMCSIKWEMPFSDFVSYREPTLNKTKAVIASVPSIFAVIKRSPFLSVVF